MQFKNIMRWFSRKRILVLAFVFSVLMFTTAIYRFAKQNNWLSIEFAKQVQNIEQKDAFAKLNLYIKNVESANRGYAISGNPAFVVNFDAGIDSIRAINKLIKEFEKGRKDTIDALLFLRADRLIEQKIAFMQRQKKLCDEGNCKEAVAMIATNDGWRLSDSIIKINAQISEGFKERLKKSQQAFLHEKNRNSRLAYLGITASMLLIMVVFYFLLAEITKTKKITAELLVRKENYRITLNSLGEGLITTDKEGNVVFMNPSAEQLTGWNWRDAKNKPLHEIFNVVNEQTGKPIEQIAGRILKTGKKIEWENNTILKSKTTASFIISNSASPIFDSKRNISGAVLVFNDITEKYKIEKELKESERQYRNLIEQASDAIIIYSFDGTIYEFNKACYTLLGYSKEEYSKLKLNDIIAGEIVENQENYTAILKGDTKIIYRCLKCKDGSLLEAEVSVKMLADGKAIAFTRDITERKKAERELSNSNTRLENAEKLAGLGSWQWDLVTNKRYWSKNMFSLFGLESANCPPHLEEYLDLIHIDERKMVEERMLKISQGIELPVYEYRTNPEKGPVRNLHATLYNEKNSAGKIIKYGGTLVDITERKKAEETIKKERDLLDYVVNSLPGIFYLLDENVKFLHWNKNFEIATGYNAAEIAVMHPLDFFDVDEKPVIAEKIGEVLTKGEINLETSFYTKERKKIPYYLTGFKIEYDGKTHIIGIGLDITERKTAELALAESENYLRTIVQAEPECVKILNRKGQLEDMNPAGLAMIEADSIMQVKGKSILRIIDEPYRNAFTGLTKEVFNGNSGKLEFKITGLKGAQRWLETHAVPLKNAAGEIKSLLSVTRDITERKNAEDAIKESEEKFRTLVQQAVEGIFIVDVEGNYLEANDSAARLTGYSIEDLKKMNATDIVEPDDLKKNPIKLEDIKKGNPVFAERIIKRKDKSLIYVEISAKLMNNGKVISILRDITERKKAEKEIGDYKFALDEASLVSITDANGIILHVNENFCSISKYSREELIGHDHRILNSGYHTKAFVKNLWETITKGKIWHEEVKNKAKDGSYYWVDTTIVPFLGQDGKPFQYMTIRSDITKRKNAETKMKSAFERYDILARATSDTIWDWDIVNNKMLYNDGIFNMFGYKASEIENVVDWWNEKLHPEDHMKVQRLLRNIFENGLQRFQFTYRFRCADGSYKYIFDRAFVLFDDEGKPSRMIGAMQDITYQKEEEIRIGKAIIQAQETERHEIGMELHDNVNQVLSTSLLYLGMAKEKQGNNTKATDNIESGRKYIGEAINEIRRLSHMLAPASFNEAFLKEDFESLVNAINVNNQFVVQLHFESFEKNTVSYEVQINLYRILQEQLNNIIKYAKATTVAIDVTLINQAIRLRIADNGKGFDVKTVKNGNGLKNMQRRAKLFAGEVTISSSPDNGCEIIVTLPLNDAG